VLPEQLSLRGRRHFELRIPPLRCGMKNKKGGMKNKKAK
jgi:hypothetical protein